MPGTVLTQQNFENADSVGLPVIALPTDAEYFMFDHPSVLRWWDAGHGVLDEQWHCRKTGAALIKKSTTFPIVESIAAFNNRPSLRFPTSASRLWDGGAGLLPGTPAATWVVIGRPGPNDNANLIGNDVANGSLIQHRGADASDGGTNLTLNNVAANLSTIEVTMGPSGPYPRRYADGINIYMQGYDVATQRAGNRMNRGRADNVRTLAPGSITANTNLVLNVGGSGVNGATGPIDGGALCSIALVDQFLWDTDYLALRANIETYAGMFGITAP